MNIKSFFTEYWHYLSLKTACSLEIFDKIHTGENTITAIAEKNDYNKKILHCLLSELENLDLVFSRKNKFFLTEKGMIFTENHPKSLKYACILWGEEHLSAWQNLEYTIKTGKPAFDKLYGKKFFDFIAENPDKLKIYHRAMDEYARDDYANICKVIDFSQFSSILDIGGGLGRIIKIIQKEYPYKKIFLFDRQEVVDLSDLPEHQKIAGDFFVGIPQTADAMIISRVLHDWDDSNCSLILGNIYKALSGKATLFVIENFTDKIPDNATILSLNMAVMTNSFERSESQYRQLLSSNGFKVEHRKKLNDFQWVLTCTKNIK